MGDATIGKKVNIGAGTITCNYDGKVKHKTIIEDGSFLRLSTINLGYQFDKVNLYVSAQNLFTFTAYSGYNPEVTSFLYDGLRNGVDSNGQPKNKKFLIGLNFNL